MSNSPQLLLNRTGITAYSSVESAPAQYPLQETKTTNQSHTVYAETEDKQCHCGVGNFGGESEVKFTLKTV